MSRPMPIQPQCTRGPVDVGYRRPQSPAPRNSKIVIIPNAVRASMESSSSRATSFFWPLQSRMLTIRLAPTGVAPAKNFTIRTLGSFARNLAVLHIGRLTFAIVDESRAVIDAEFRLSVVPVVMVIRMGRDRLGLLEREGRSNQEKHGNEAGAHGPDHVSRRYRHPEDNTGERRTRWGFRRMVAARRSPQNTKGGKPFDSRPALTRQQPAACSWLARLTLSV